MNLLFKFEFIYNGLFNPKVFFVVNKSTPIGFTQSRTSKK